jgi:cystathionine beta-lyase/cystathionine gamma-synthase
MNLPGQAKETGICNKKLLVMLEQTMKFSTQIIHAGQHPDPTTGAVMTPIYQTSTYKQDGVGKHRGYEYSRTGNPTRSALEACIASLEGGKYGLAFASGMAATDTVLRLLGPGDHILAGNDIYGGTFRLFDKEYRRYGMVFSYVDTTDTAQVEAGLRSNTRMVWLETPTNPLLSINDIQAIAKIVHSHNPETLLVVDNTFATPYLQRPLKLGADIVVHSTTKYLGGHSDVVGGAVIIRQPSIHERLAFLQNAVGAVPGPMDCFLVLRGIKTLPVRMDRHAHNATVIANFLAGHPNVARLYYPFHVTHPGVEIARKQMRNGGGMVSFIHKAGAEAARNLVEHTRIFTLAESLGGVESLIEVPAAMTHASTANSPLAVDPGLIRLSVGLEHEADLISDLERAFSYSSNKTVLSS